MQTRSPTIIEPFVPLYNVLCLIVQALPALEEHVAQTLGSPNISQAQALAYLGQYTHTTEEQFDNYELWESLQFLRRAQAVGEYAIAQQARMVLM